MRAQRYTLSLLALARSLYGQSLPYNPSHILWPPNSTTAYIFQPSIGSSGQSKLLTIDLTDTLHASDLSIETISSSLPFLADEELIPYNPAIESDGSIAVLAGKCADGASGAKVWRYATDSQDGSGTPSWKESQTTVLGSTAGLTGSDFLAATASFSENIYGGQNTTSIYVFGGMCPSSASTESTWQSNAEYSNSMLELTPQGSGYKLRLVSSRGPPISQAGVSITPLPPSYSTASNGAILGQQQDFVLLGGHTQSAFINTSEVAVFSLPQQSWSFIPIQQPSNSKTDLTVRQSAQEVTPRSGHTAILAEDGKSIILFGGWVGDVNTPAEPQLAILELGAAYGGTGGWKWTIPQLPSGILSGIGIFGHGAAMLPGGVMMVVGGYQISGSPSRFFKRNNMPHNNRVFFYNATSNSWLDSYTATDLGSQSNDSGPLGSTSKKVGLGTGLGIGAALLASVVVFYFWYSKRLQRARDEREQTLLTYSSDGSVGEHIDQPFLEHGGIDGRGGEEYALGGYWPTGGASGSRALPRAPPMQHTTGMFVNVPSPTRGLRKGAIGKNYQYHAAPRYDDKRMSKASGNIHPIAEQENEDGADITDHNSKRDGLSDAEDKLREVERMLAGDDPFSDPLPNPLGSHPVSPDDTVRRVPTSASRISIPQRKPIPTSQEAPNWVEVGDGEASHEEDPGRISPSKSDERTSSTLSEESHYSTASSGSITRTMSTRTGALLAAAVAARGQATDNCESPTDGRTNTMSTDGRSIASSHFRTRARSSTNGSMTPGGLQSIADDAEFTARSNITQLRSDGQMLLGRTPELDRDGPYQRAQAANATSSPSSLAASKRGPPPIIPQRRRPGLMGSLRRALNVMSMTERTLSFGSNVTEPYRDDVRSSSSSPTKMRPPKAGSGPRRAVSDGGALLKQKRGQKDWSEKDWEPYKQNLDPGDWGEPQTVEEKRQAEEDWDVEGAASNRDFQVMFSIPKARLRVVNDDMDRASLRSASDGAVSRNGSVKQLTREESIKVLRARADGEKPRLPSTEEKEEESEKPKAA